MSLSEERQDDAAPGAGVVAGVDGHGATRKVRLSLIEDHPVAPELRKPLEQFLARLTIPQKVELATKGNREVRGILARDPSAMVARAVIASPRLSEGDVLAYAGSPLTNDEILRAIGESREWLRNRKTVVLLATNPRTPPGAGLKLLGLLSVHELNLLARNRNVPAVVRREAKRRVGAARA